MDAVPYALASFHPPTKEKKKREARNKNPLSVCGKKRTDRKEGDLNSRAPFFVCLDSGLSLFFLGGCCTCPYILGTPGRASRATPLFLEVSTFRVSFLCAVCPKGRIFMGLAHRDQTNCTLSPSLSLVFFLSRRLWGLGDVQGKRACLARPRERKGKKVKGQALWGSGAARSRGVGREATKRGNGSRRLQMHSST